MASPLVRQSWTLSGILFNMVAQGITLTYPSVLIPGLEAPDSDIKIDLATGSWLASIIGISGIFGFSVSSWLMEVLGRKKTHFIMILPGVFGWMCLYFSFNVTCLMIGRLLCGFSSAGTVTLGAVIIGEYASPSNRGMFLNLKTASVCLGNTLVHIFGHFFSWRSVALMALIPNVTALVVITSWPESPVWLASKKQFDKSEMSFNFLRGHGEKAKRELDSLLRQQKEILDIPTKKSSFMQKIVLFRKKITRRDFVLPVLIVLFASLLLESCGRHVFPTYAIQIIGSITGNKGQSIYYILAIDCITLISSVASSGLVKVLKRRQILFASGISSVIVLSFICIYLFLSSNQIISNDYSFVPMAMFGLYFILANLGCTPIPLSLLGEVFPVAHRGTGSAVSGLCMAFCLILFMKVTPGLLRSIDVYGTFAVYAIAMVTALVFLYFTLPETKDRTLQEIEYFFNHGKFRDDDKHIDNETQTDKLLKNIPMVEITSK